VVVCCVIATGLMACGSAHRVAAHASPTPSYRVLTSSHGDSAVYAIEVHSGVTRAQLAAITEAVIVQAKKVHPFLILWLEFYDYPQLAEYAGPSLGWARFGPGSKFAVAGDYDKMSLTAHFLTKDWSKRPSQDEVGVWTRWQKLYWKPGHVGDLSPTQLDRRVAKQLQLPVERVHAAVRAVDAWATPPIGRIW
jgi:hypothetical protein